MRAVFDACVRPDLSWPLTSRAVSVSRAESLCISILFLTDLVFVLLCDCSRCFGVVYWDSICICCALCGLAAVLMRTEILDRCKAQAAPTNGNVKCTRARHRTQLFYKTKCVFSCKPGYKMLGPVVKQCNGTGHWDDTEEPMCIRMCGLFFVFSFPFFVLNYFIRIPNITFCAPNLILCALFLSANRYLSGLGCHSKLGVSEFTTS